MDDELYWSFLIDKEIEDLHINSTIVNTSLRRGEFCLIAGVIVNKTIYRDVIQQTMNKSVNMIDANHLLIGFKTEENKNRVMRWRPWLMELLEGLMIFV